MALCDKIEANLDSNRSTLSKRLKELLSKDEKVISVLCRILCSSILNIVNIIPKKCICMFQKVIPKVKAILTEADFKHFAQDLAAEIDSLYNIGKIKDTAYSTLRNALCTINPIEVKVTHNHNHNLLENAFSIYYIGLVLSSNAPLT